MKARNWKPILSRIQAVLMRRGRSVHDAEDLAQDAWLHLAQYERKQLVHEPEAFLMRAALNLSTDAYRTQANHGVQLVVDDVVLMDTAPSIEARVLAQEQLARLDVCVAGLNPKTRDIFMAHRHEGLRYEDIARRYGLSVSAVEKHIARALLEVTGFMEGWYP